jgi:hypothetical protein
VSAFVPSLSWQTIPFSFLFVPLRTAAHHILRVEVFLRDLDGQISNGILLVDRVRKGLYRKNASLFRVLSLCLSRACLGQLIVFSIKLVPKHGLVPHR